MRIHVKRKNKWEDQRLKFYQDKFAEGFIVVGKKDKMLRQPSFKARVQKIIYHRNTDDINPPLYFLEDKFQELPFTLGVKAVPMYQIQLS